jgi:hypothetical protein
MAVDVVESVFADVLVKMVKFAVMVVVVAAAIIVESVGVVVIVFLVVQVVVIVFFAGGVIVAVIVITVFDIIKVEVVVVYRSSRCRSQKVEAVIIINRNQVKKS